MRCSVFIAISLDGFIARRDGRIDWLSIVERPGEDHGFQKFYDSVDTIVMGRKTWETALGFEAWPYTGKRVVVLSKSTHRAMHGEDFFSGDVRELDLSRSKRTYVDGGNVIAQFLAAKRIDDLTIAIIPILLGDGTPLAPGLGRDVPLRLVQHRAFDSGLVQLEYVP